MAFLRLRDLTSGEEQEFEGADVRIGRDPAFDLVPTGPGSDVVSARHCRLMFEEGRWWIEDTGSSNGTFLEADRLAPEVRVPLDRGATIRLGQAGPRFRVEATASARVANTVIEPMRAVDPAQTQPMAPPGQPALPGHEGSDSLSVGPRGRAAPGMAVVLLDLRDDITYQATGDRIRIGRGSECEVRPIREGDTVVSRVHAEIVLAPDGTILIRDAQSRNGTLVNGERLEGGHELEPGDRIELGRGGPELRVERLEVTGSQEDAAGVATPSGPAAGPPPPKPAPAVVRRSFGGKGRTMFVREVIHETARKSSHRLRLFVWVAVTLLAGAVGALYWWSEQRVRETEQMLARTSAALAEQQALADSVRAVARDDRDRLRRELALARNSAAPASVVDSLRVLLDSATARTEALEVALTRAQGELQGQLAAAESLRTDREREVRRLSRQLEAAAASRVPSSLVDSLRQAVQDAERQVRSLDGQMRAVRGVNLAAVAQANQGAVGLISSYVGTRQFAGSGFVVSPSGVLITNRHVVFVDGRRADSIFVTMADHRERSPVRVIRISMRPGPDLAVLRIPGYHGPYVPRVDWSGTRARQGEPAALIGFPTGLSVALDLTATVRTSMSAGIFSKVTTDQIQFDGFTVGGSSGSPIFNAAGEVVAVHRSGLRDAAGLAFAVPIAGVIPLLPPDVRAELRIPG